MRVFAPAPFRYPAQTGKDYPYGFQDISDDNVARMLIAAGIVQNAGSGPDPAVSSGAKPGVITAKQLAAGADSPAATDALGNLIAGDAVPALTPFVPSIRGALAAYSTSYDPTTGLALQNAIPPWLWQDTDGFAGAMHALTRCGVGFFLGNIGYFIGTAAADRACYIVDKAAGTITKRAAHIDVQSNIHHIWTVDSRTAIFASFAPLNSSTHSTGQQLYRSIDGGASFQIVADTTQMPLVDDYPGTLTEMDNGWLIMSIYNSVAPVGSCTRKVYRSKDGGNTWVDITPAIDAATTYARHIHCTYWDDFRKLLFVTGGDGGAMKVTVSADRGDTFVAMPNTWETTAVAASATCIILASDVNGYHGLYRIVGATLADLLAAQPVLVWRLGTKSTPICDCAGLDGTAIAWVGEYTSDGIFVFPYGRIGNGAVLMMSSDDGFSWVDGLGATASTPNTFVSAQSGTQWGWEPVRPTGLAAKTLGWDGWRYTRQNGTNGSTRRWRPYRGGVQLHVNSVTGDNVSGDGITTPFATIPESGITPAARIVLDADYTKPAIPTRAGIVIDRGSFRLGVTDGGGTLLFADNFEGGSSTTFVTAVGGTGPGTVNLASTANVQSNTFLSAGGTKNARCTAVNAGDTAMVSTPAAVNTLLAAIAQGHELTFVFRISLNAASITQTVVIAQIQNAMNISLNSTGAMLVTTTGDSVIYQQNQADVVAFPMAPAATDFITCKVRVLKHATAGRIRIWQGRGDGLAMVKKQLFDLRGVNTLGSAWSAVRIGLNGAQAGLIADVDDVVGAVDFDPEYPGDRLLMGSGQLVLPDMLRS